MLDKLIKQLGVYGDEEYSFECEDLFETLIRRVLDNEVDLQTVMRYLLEKTDFLDWIEETYHNVELKEEHCEEQENDEDEQIAMFNAQAVILKETQEELNNLKKKYNNLLRKYKSMKGSL